MDSGFRNGRKGGRLSGKGTQPPLLELPRSLPFPSTRARLGQRPRRPHHPPRGHARRLHFPGRPPARGIPPRRPSPASAARPPGFVCGGVALGRSLSPTFPRVQPVTRSPISWWILLKRQRSRSRTKAIVLFPPRGSAS